MTLNELDEMHAIDSRLEAHGKGVHDDLVRAWCRGIRRPSVRHGRETVP